MSDASGNIAFIFGSKKRNINPYAIFFIALGVAIICPFFAAIGINIFTFPETSILEGTAMYLLSVAGALFIMLHLSGIDNGPTVKHFFWIWISASAGLAIIAYVGILEIYLLRFLF